MADDGRQGKLATRAAPTRHAIASVWCRIPLDMNILRAVKRSPLGLDLYLWLTYRTFALKAPLCLSWRQLYRQFGVDPPRLAIRTPYTTSARTVTAS